MEQRKQTNESYGTKKKEIQGRNSCSKKMNSEIESLDLLINNQYPFMD